MFAHIRVAQTCRFLRRVAIVFGTWMGRPVRSTGWKRWRGKAERNAMQPSAVSSRVE